MLKPRGWGSVDVLDRYVSLPLAPSTLNVAIVLLVRSEMYMNLPFGVMWMSAAQMSLSVLRGGGPPGTPTAPRGAPGPSLVSGGRPVAVLTSVSSPVLPSIAKVVTVPSSSLSAYRYRLSLDVMKWRGPVIALVR